MELEHSYSLVVLAEKTKKLLTGAAVALSMVFGTPNQSNAQTLEETLYGVIVYMFTDSPSKDKFVLPTIPFPLKGDNSGLIDKAFQGYIETINSLEEIDTLEFLNGFINTGSLFDLSGDNYLELLSYYLKLNKIDIHKLSLLNQLRDFYNKERPNKFDEMTFFVKNKGFITIDQIKLIFQEYFIHLENEKLRPQRINLISGFLALILSMLIIGLVVDNKRKKENKSQLFFVGD